MARQSLLPSINFLRRKRQRLEILQKRDSYFLMGASAFLGLTLIVLLGLFGLWFWNQKQTVELAEKQKESEQIIRQRSADEAEYLLFAKRLDLLAGIFSSQISQQKTLEFLSGLRTEGVLFRGITYDPSQRSVSFSATATDITRFDSFLNLIRSPDILARISRLTVSQVGRDELGQYSMEVSFQLTQAT